MRRNLILLDLLLAVLIGVVSWQFWTGYSDRLRQQQAFLKIPAPAAPPALVSIPAPPGQVSAANYVEVASVLLFSKDRNPTVIVDVVPPKQVPAFPRYYGMMNWGGGPKVILAPKAGDPQKSYVPGDTVGDFKLVTIAQSGLVFEWDGKKIPAKYEEMKDTSAPRQETASTGSQGARGASVVNVSSPASSGGSESPVKRVTEPVVNLSGPTRGPGGDQGGGVRGCVPGDSTPSGAIVDGYRKIVSVNPFGGGCRWERVQ
ncbi:hypothetical protein [uncultured Paludibaculum sp.]|uniref:hypothetical protein n=1 Tax=uncultured Paludibaculum sp. TaxID=1765020 RepID=UPI002AABA846|nr:hypothetical protein [uncultured Paludibaculum sp.]